MFSSTEIHVTFTYENNEFEVWEPFGDNSRLHIGSNNKLTDGIIIRLEKDVASTKNYFI